MQRRKYCLVIVCLCAMLLGCGNTARTSALVDYRTGAHENASSNTDGSQGPGITGTLSGDWGERVTKNGNHGRAFELDSPLYQCGGFDLKYTITEVTAGKVKEGSQFKVFVRTTDGQWQGVKMLEIHNMTLEDEIRFDSKMDIDAVCVICYQEGKFSYSGLMQLSDPV